MRLTFRPLLSISQLKQQPTSWPVHEQSNENRGGHRTDLPSQPLQQWRSTGATGNAYLLKVLIECQQHTVAVDFVINDVCGMQVRKAWQHGRKV